MPKAAAKPKAVTSRTSSNKAVKKVEVKKSTKVTKTIAKKNVKVDSKKIAKIGSKLEGTSAISRPKILEF